VKTEVKIKTRNWHVVNARWRRNGPMKDRKKEARRKACRGKVRLDD
jgi:hypothetical protein